MTNDSRPKLGSLPSDWDTVPVEPLVQWFCSMEQVAWRDEDRVQLESIINGPDNYIRALTLRCMMLAALNEKIVVTRQVIEAMASRPISEATTLLELVVEFGS